MAKLSGLSVVVAGAGLAGLAAARALCGEGARVTVVEARSRVGGRVLTLRGFEGGQHGEAGGELIDEEQSTLRRLAEELGLTLVPVLKRGFRLVSERHAESSFAWRELERLFAPALHAWRLAERRWDSTTARRLGAMSVSEWLDEHHAEARVRATAVSLRNFFLADPDDLSLLEMLDQIASGGDPSHIRCYRVRGGNDRLAEALAAPLAGALHLRTRLLALHDLGSGVRLSLEAADGAMTSLEADYVIATLPLPALRELRISPPLPQAQGRAFAALRYGPATKVLAQFAARFWRALRRGRAWGTDQLVGAAWDGNEEQGGRAGILVLLGGGAAAIHLERLLAAGAAPLVAELGFLGKPSPLLEARVVAWHEDRLARGAYAYFDPSFDPALRVQLAQPHGRILFAGEHTSMSWQGYMNGAIESGLRAAAEVEALHYLRAAAVPPPAEPRLRPAAARRPHPLWRVRRR